MVIIVLGFAVLKSPGKDSHKRSVIMERRRKRRSFDWLNSTWTSWRKKASLVPHVSILWHGHMMMMVFLLSYVFSTEENKAENDSFEADLIAGRLQEEVVRLDTEKIPKGYNSFLSSVNIYRPHRFMFCQMSLPSSEILWASEGYLVIMLKL